MKARRSRVPKSVITVRNRVGSGSVTTPVLAPPVVPPVNGRSLLKSPVPVRASFPR
jgi:hypothetical protein